MATILERSERSNGLHIEFERQKILDYENAR